MVIAAGIYCSLDREMPTDSTHLFEVKKASIRDFLSLKEISYFEFFLFTAGKGVLTVNGDPYPIQRGGFAFLTPFHLFQIDEVGEVPIEYYSVKIDWDYLGKIETFTVPRASEMQKFIENKPYLIIEGDTYDQVLSRFVQLEDESANRREYGRLLSAACVQYLYLRHSILADLATSDSKEFDLTKAN